ncbi:PREDICTED: glutathione S-transferase 1-like [Nicrophorus vespilloides]|uniref:Glutathione S-transferase 1-like n=1 Tax=Nicrophorus vespilloides TaxID=110193 RepID=A0ABM1M407_NICVS|nr:PREDICTED: glutathione S-transferase 1-like [Nicrophorus vespilloides]
MVLKLYTTVLSPPCRSVLICEQALGLQIEHIETNLLQREQMKPELTEINPQHTIPTLIDDDVVIWDSHAIMSYLVEKYGSDQESLYPKDLAERSLVDQRLHFDSGCVFTLIRRIVEAMLDKSSLSADETCKALAHRHYKFLDDFLIDKDWVCGDSITIADFSLIPSITALDALVPMGDGYGNITSWLQKFDELSYSDINKNGLEEFKRFMQIVLS